MNSEPNDETLGFEPLIQAGEDVFFDLCQATTPDQLLDRINSMLTSQDGRLAVAVAACYAVTRYAHSRSTVLGTRTPLAEAFEEYDLRRGRQFREAQISERRKRS